MSRRDLASRVSGRVRGVYAAQQRDQGTGSGLDFCVGAVLAMSVNVGAAITHTVVANVVAGVSTSVAAIFVARAVAKLGTD